jgi:EpsI family protein
LGHTYTTKIVILFSCFFFTAIIIYWDFDSKVTTKRIPLSQAVNNLKGWKITGFTNLDKSIVEALNLDDYVNQNYFKGNKTVSLYIGYYNTGKKVGAAHSPLVCFPGQGWVVKDKKKNNLILNPKNDEKVSYSSMVAERSGEKELVVYWVQSYDTTTRDTFSQKITLLWNRLFNKGEDNAFVRITMRIGEKSAPECEETIKEFIKAFYPVFLEYVKTG